MPTSSILPHCYHEHSNRESSGVYFTLGGILLIKEEVHEGVEVVQQKLRHLHLSARKAGGAGIFAPSGNS